MASTPPRVPYDLFFSLGPYLTEYVDLSEYNIHVIWETTLRLWLAKLPFLAERAPPGLADSLEQRSRRAMSA